MQDQGIGPIGSNATKPSAGGDIHSTAGKGDGAFRAGDGGTGGDGGSISFRAGDGTSRSAAPESLSAIADQLRSIPSQFRLGEANTVGLDAGTLAGALLVHATECGAFSEPKFASLRQMIKLAHQGRLSHQSDPPGARRVAEGGSVHRSPPGEWHAFSTAYVWLLTEQGRETSARPTERAFVEPACYALADLIENAIDPSSPGVVTRATPPLATSDDGWAALPPHVLRAGESLEWVERERPELAPDDQGVGVPSRAQFDFIKEHGCPAYPEDSRGESTIPGFATWRRYIRTYRAATRGPDAVDEPRARVGRSIVNVDGSRSDGRDS